MSASDAARTGMLFQQRNVETISNNIVNANTVGFKRATVRFGDVFTRVRDLFDAASGAPGNLADSEGILITGIDRVMLQGGLEPTAGPTDLAIVGEGFFEVALPDGTSAYTRDGSFQVDADGRLVTSHGLPLQPEVIAPAGTTELAIGQDGTLTAIVGGQQQVLGQMELTVFTNPAGLLAYGENLFLPSENSGEARPGVVGTEGRGFVTAGALEASNVELSEEMTALIVAQRSYQMSLSAYQTANDMDRQARELAGRS